VPQAVVNQLLQKSPPSERRRILGMTKSRLGLKNVNLALIVKKNQEILLQEPAALISKKRAILAFVLPAEHQEKVEMVNGDPITVALVLLKEMTKEVHHVVSGIPVLLVGRESLTATAQHAKPMVMAQDLIANVHRMENENLIAIVRHAEQMEMQLDHIPNAHLAAKELLMEIVRHVERMAKATAQDLINHVLPANAVLLENVLMLKI
jgi:hypothetical protein